MNENLVFFSPLAIEVYKGTKIATIPEFGSALIVFIRNHMTVNRHVLCFYYSKTCVLFWLSAIHVNCARVIQKKHCAAD